MISRVLHSKSLFSRRDWTPPKTLNTKYTALVADLDNLVNQKRKGQSKILTIEDSINFKLHIGRDS